MEPRTPTQPPETQDDTLSVLLRAKRLERPNAATLEAIELGFRAKQRASALPPRRWWHSVPLLRRRIVQLGGASAVAAALALAFVPARVAIPTAGPVRTAQPSPRSAAPVSGVAVMPAVLVEAASGSAPIVQADFVVDVMERSAGADRAYTTEAAPQTLFVGGNEAYAVLTMRADAGGNTP